MTANKAQMDCLIQAIESAFNPSDFILEIEARPAIWNHTDSMYNNQACKRAAWDSLIRKYYPDFDDRPNIEQTLISTHYRKKWKSFRDSFARELSKLKNATKPRKTKYIYFNQLSFLLSVKGLPNTCNDDLESLLMDSRVEQMEEDNEDNMTSNDGPDFSAFDMQPPDITGNLYKTGFSSNRTKPDSPPYFSNEDASLHHADLKRKRLASPEREFWNRFDRGNSIEDDEDKLFLLSLVSELKRVPHAMKLDVKCELLSVFKNARMQYTSIVSRVDENGVDSPALSDSNHQTNTDLDLYTGVKNEKTACSSNSSSLNNNSCN